MFTVLTCIADQHDSKLLLVALVICGLSAVTGLSIYSRAIPAKGARRAGWSIFAGFVLGCGVWATHFVSMLAFEGRMRIAYAPGLTALSLTAAVVILSCGLLVAARSRTFAGRLAGGGVVGLGIAAMHFVGVAAMAGPTIISVDHGLIAAGLVIGVGLAAAAMNVLARGASPVRLGSAALLLGGAIVGVHFTAMAALTLAPDEAASASSAVLGRLPLAASVSCVIALILLVSVTLLMVASRSARSALQTLQSALDVAPSAIAFFDRRQRLTFWNKPYAELFSVFGMAPVAGLRFDDILAAAVAAGVPYRTASPGGPALGWENPPDELALPDGRILQSKVSATEDGGLVAMLIDVTLARQAEHDAHEARKRAEAANQLKSDFLATIGHELRTPLNGVLGMAYVMEARPLESAQRERLHVIKASGETLLTLLNDLLDLAKIEAGHMSLEDLQFDLEATLRPACQAFEAIAGEKGVAFNLRIAPTAAGEWRGDPHRLRQVVSNLASNAVKFTSSGAVDMIVDATDFGLRIIVRDTGIGMKSEQIPRIFEKFTQADSSTTRKFGGTGLGLAICRELTALMSGTLTADSVEGEGSTFTFEAPLALVAPARFGRNGPAGRPRLYQVA